jgi:glycine reductase
MIKKKRVVCFLNQFFGQIGGEEMASVGFRLESKPVGSAVLFNSFLKDEGEVVGTVICGDNYFAENTEKAAKEGLDLIAGLEPDLLFCGPAFNAGRYGISCGKMASAVAEQLKIPTVTGMYPENPAAEIYRRQTYIVKTGIRSSEMRNVVPVMVDIGLRLAKGEPVGNADKEGYIMRDVILNEIQDQNSANRAINMVLAKLSGKSFVSELLPPVFESIVPAPAVKDISKAKIALITDGGLIPQSNPDKLKPNASLTFGVYNRKKLFAENPFVIHSGYDGTWVVQNPMRLFPEDAAEDLVHEGKLGSLDEDVYVACGNCASIEASKRIGSQIAAKLLMKGIQAAILTST